MATDFWSSTHYKRWIVDRATLRQARADDMRYVDDPEIFVYFSLFFANSITRLGKKLGFRQRVIATAIVFFRRFYLKNSYCETDPFIVIAACCYVAGKAEESPSHIKNIATEARFLFSQQPYWVKNFPVDNSKLAEMEFYLVADLECDLTVFHPYRTLMSLCQKEGSSESQTEAGEVGVGIDDGPRYWGTGEGHLELPDEALQLAWSIINDMYRSDLCLLYPPHLLAITALYLTLALHTPTKELIMQKSQFSPSDDSHISPRRSSRQVSSSLFGSKKPPDFIGFFAGLNVSMPLIATIAQEMISLYSMWERYKEEVDTSDTPRSAFHTQSNSPYSATTQGTGNGLSESLSATHSRVGTPVVEGPDDMRKADGMSVVTSATLVQTLTRMRENRVSDLARHSTGGRPVVINKMLERAQAAG
ncbi:cyclin-like protein [Pisolithus orientalis]|uniref:cyclin-like protein n=1 Tax=Pisolithus orientalis TaxID=936130 RepID=UPI00222469FA|nr:cyclin-like protein [Pisolithus orientalis]KAI6014986.1 cyclin-like protein [Pisolithus orientalis]